VKTCDDFIQDINSYIKKLKYKSVCSSYWEYKKAGNAVKLFILMRNGAKFFSKVNFVQYSYEQSYAKTLSIAYDIILKDLNKALDKYNKKEIMSFRNRMRSYYHDIRHMRNSELVHGLNISLFGMDIQHGERIIYVDFFVKGRLTIFEVITTGGIIWENSIYCLALKYEFYTFERFVKEFKKGLKKCEEQKIKYLNY